MGNARRVLILSVTAGAGHVRAGQALEEAFRDGYPDAEVRHADALDYTNAAFRKGFSEGYETLAKDLPSLWGYIYESLEEPQAKRQIKKLAVLFDRLNAQPLRRMVREYDPDRIVCTHYVPAEVLGPLRRKGKLRAPIFVTLTDYDVHTMWIQAGVDCYFVATEEMAYALRAISGKDARVEATGIPILGVFAQPYPGRPLMRKQLGLDPARPAVLISAGGMGLMGADRVVAALADHVPDVQLLAVAGKNAKLQRQVEAAARSTQGRVIPFGFVNNMHELMAASDFAVAKSGGLTTSECLAMGLPIVVFKPIPGQEERNATFLLEHGAGLWAHTAAHMVYKAEQLLKDPDRLAAMQAAARRIAKPDAARRIADTVMQHEA